MIEVKTQEELDKVISENPKVVVVFSALEWCVPCQRLHNFIPKIEEKNPGVVFVSVDDAEPHKNELMQEFNVSSVPSVWMLETSESGGVTVGGQVDTKDLPGPRLSKVIGEYFR